MVLYAPLSLFSLFISTIALLAVGEYSGFAVSAGRPRLQRAAALAAAAAAPVLFHLFGPSVVGPYVAALVLAAFAARMAATAAPLQGAAAEVASTVFGVLYIALPASYLVAIRGLDSGELWILFLFVMGWANDTFAYYVGRSLGRRRLSPRISPRKTVEGAVGGAAGAMAAAWLFAGLAGLPMSPAAAAALSVPLAALAVVGDLSESLLKRSAGVKDSSSIIPGHGGVLDRFDSFLFTTPALYYFLSWRTHYLL